MGILDIDSNIDFTNHDCLKSLISNYIKKHGMHGYVVDGDSTNYEISNKISNICIDIVLNNPEEYRLCYKMITSKYIIIEIFHEQDQRLSQYNSFTICKPPIFKFITVKDILDYEPIGCRCK